MNQIYTYNAGKGECIRLRYGDGHNIFIDTGVTRFADTLKRLCREIVDAGETLDLLILTHVDDDHIGGILALLRMGWKCPFREVRMNGADSTGADNAQLSTRQNCEVAKMLRKQQVKITPMTAGDVFYVSGEEITAIHPGKLENDREYGNTPLAHYKSDYAVDLSELAERPITKKDTSINNKNSVVFIFQFQGKRFLFTGDAWAEDIIAGLGREKQRFDLVKLPHHGAVGNISEEFPEHISCENFLICTDGVMHPDKQTAAKLQKWYEKIRIFSPSDWWNRGFFTENDDRSCMELLCREGEIFQWGI